jgi:hypothetical protein
VKGGDSVSFLLHFSLLSAFGGTAKERGRGERERENERREREKAVPAAASGCIDRMRVGGVGEREVDSVSLSLSLSLVLDLSFGFLPLLPSFLPSGSLVRAACTAAVAAAGSRSSSLYIFPSFSFCTILPISLMPAAWRQLLLPFLACFLPSLLPSFLPLLSLSLSLSFSLFLSLSLFSPSMIALSVGFGLHGPAAIRSRSQMKKSRESLLSLILFLTL